MIEMNNGTPDIDYQSMKKEIYYVAIEDVLISMKSCVLVNMLKSSNDYIVQKAFEVLKKAGFTGSGIIQTMLTRGERDLFTISSLLKDVPDIKHIDFDLTSATSTLLQAITTFPLKSESPKVYKLFYVDSLEVDILKHMVKDKEHIELFRIFDKKDIEKEIAEDLQKGKIIRIIDTEISKDDYYRELGVFDIIYPRNFNFYGDNQAQIAYKAKTDIW